MNELFTLGRVRLTSPSSPPSGAATQPKRLALLAYLVVATPRGPRRRDTLLALFWPERSEDEARNALRQGPHHLRRVLGQDAIGSNADEIAIDDSSIRCDAVEFERLLDVVRAADAMALYAGDFLEGFHVSDVATELELRHRHAPARARALADSAQVAVPPSGALPGDRPYDELARFYAVAGDPSAARRFLAVADSNDRTLGRYLAADRLWTRGVIAFAEGSTARAEADLAQAATTHPCAICPLPDLARAYERAGKPNAAIVVYERYLATPCLWRFEIDAYELGWVMKRLAEHYAARGDDAKASAMRMRLQQLWRRADADLAPP
jgi:hypothetical protein